MANPTTKFVSVNLNKSYGQQQSNRPSSSPSPYHGGIASRANRPAGGNSAGGGGMVVLSRPRSSVSSGPKNGARLSVPPPLNLPSLRKEHERFDPSAGSGSLSGASSSGLGLGRGGSAVMGWNKPSTSLLGSQDKDTLPRDLPGRPGSGDQRVGSPGGGYTAPAKPGTPLLASASSTSALSAVQKAVLLKGEDFPSLQASIISNQKQKDALVLKQKQQGGEELHDGQLDKPILFASSIPMRPQMRSSHTDSFKELNGDGGPNRTSGGSLTDRSLHKLDDILPGPLPMMVQLRHTSDWADDERDTGLAIPDRSKDKSYSRNEANRTYNYYDQRGLHDTEPHMGASKKELSKAESFGRDTPVTDRNANPWRQSMHPKDGFGARENALIERDGPLARVLSHGKDSLKDGSKYGQFSNGGRDSSRYDFPDVQQNRVDFSGPGQNLRNSRNGMDAYNRRNSEQSLPGRLADASSNRFRGGSLQNNSLSSGGKGFPLDDPILNFRRFPTSSRKPFLDGANFDDQDTLTGGILGDVSMKAFRKKKDVQTPIELNDPVRESFEAELERVQRMQEEERQRVLQEHARAVELARKEEEERQRLAREEEEKRRQLEQEARDAVWRAEQEKLEAAKLAEEKRVAREEEKKRILMEEERRKEAARQKLLELEARIAKRQAEESEKSSKPPAVGGNDQILGEVKQQDTQKFSDAGEWEDGERMVEQITSSTLTDPPSTNKFYGHGSGLPSSANGYVSSKDSGKQSTYWKNEAYDNGSNSVIFAEQANGHHAPRRDAFNAGRVITRKNFYSSSGNLPARPSSKGGTPEAPHSFVDEYYPNLRGGHRWNIPGDGDRFLRNNTAEPELLENDKFGEIGWERSQSSDGPIPLYGDSLFQNSGVEGFSSGRSRYFPRQPRVLPPPSFSSTPKNTFKMNPERSNSTPYLESENRLQNTEKSDKERQETYESGYLESKEQHHEVSITVENASLAAPNDNSSSSLSQSSASVSSPPSSPDNMYPDEFDDSGDLPVLLESADEKPMALSEDDSDIDATESGKTNNAVASRSLASREEVEWTVENNDVHAQDEYEDEQDYQEEVDGHEDEDGADIVQEFYLHPDIQNGSADLEQDQQVLGFNEGTEVRITSSDEFEIESDNDEKDIEAQVIPNVTRQEAASADGFLNNDDNLESVASFLDGSQENSELLKTTEKAMQNLVLEPDVSVSHSLGSQDMASQPVSTSASNISSLPSSLGQPIISPASTVHSQTETPMQFQFGLFSGPSLIPSPVPAIQIGSIQMPLSLHHSVRPFPHIHSSQPPFFQFGQLQYTSPMSQGILPLSPPNMPFLQSSVSAQYSLAQNSGNSLQKHVMPQSSALNPPKEVAGLLAQYKNGVVENSSELSSNKFDLKEQNAAQGNFVNNSLLSTEQVDTTHSKDPVLSQNTSQVNVPGVHDDSLRRSGGLMSNTSEQNSEHPEPAASQCVPGDRSGPELKPPGSSSGRGKRYIYAIKNSSSRSQLPESEASRADNNVFQRRIRRNTRRTEFRVRESDRKQMNDLGSFNSRIHDGKHQLNGDASVFYSRSSSRKESSSNRSSRSIAESEKLTDGILSETVGSARAMSGKDTGTKTLSSSNTYPHHSDNSFHKNDSEEDVDAPLLTGVVRVYKQPGIETPSDEDNFIEVRSKRQMLNDRREQREKEIKAKSRTLKAQQRARSLNHGIVASKVISREGLKGVPHSVVTEGSSIGNDATSSSANLGPQTPTANGHPAGSLESLDNDSGSLNTSSVQMSSGGAHSLGAIPNIPEVMFENSAFTNGTTRSATSVTSAERHLNQQVMTLTQTQLDEAMKPEYTCGTFRNNRSDAMDLTKSANHVTSVLAGEKIQFGAVTTPTYLPPVNRAIHNSIGGPRTSCKSDPIERKSAPRNDDTVFFNREKHNEQSCVHLEDQEAEAEAAASAVAVAAISSDEMVSNDTVKETIQERKNHSAGEESLIVSLPADLSVENPPSLWPILPSPQSSSNPMLSHFPGASSSHFPFFDMNPMLRGPMFAFGGQDDSVGSQSQPQKSSSLHSGPFGAWPQCPSGMDSIYGHPTGFAGPFLNPAAGMPGVQAPHPMVFYNHFSPLTQFGVSFMGGPFIPSGKQPEWRHNHLTSVGVSEPSISTQDVCSTQNNPPSIAASLQHLAPGSLMSVASPLPLFEMPPFQQPVDLPVPAQWPNMTPPVHAISLSPLSHHRLDSGIPAQINHSVSVNPSSGANVVSSRLDTQPSVSMDANFFVPANPAAQLPNELGLVEPSSSDGDCSMSNRHLYSPICRNMDGQNDPKSSSGSHCHVSEAISSVSAAVSGSTQNPKCPTKPQAVTQSISSPLSHTISSGYNDKRAGSSQKVSSGDWHRRAGFQGRKLTQGSEKNFIASKMKQIYVAKSPANGAATTG